MNNKNCIEDIVECEKCKCLVFKKSTRPITTNYWSLISQKYYCLKCRPNYDNMYFSYGGKEYFKDNVPVDEEGVPLKVIMKIEKPDVKKRA